jgi:hypothetical protein
MRPRRVPLPEPIPLVPLTDPARSHCFWTDWKIAMPAEPRSVNILLPQGLTSARYHALAQQLVARLAPQRPGSGSARPRAARGYRALSELQGAPPEHMPILNDSTWTLTVPVPADADLQAISALARSLPDGEGITIESAPDYGASPGEG